MRIGLHDTSLNESLYLSYTFNTYIVLLICYVIAAWNAALQCEESLDLMGRLFLLCFNVKNCFLLLFEKFTIRFFKLVISCFEEPIF